jgi:hypothetical protein
MTWLVYLTLAVMVVLGALAVALAMGTSRVDAVELPDDPIDADRQELPYGGGWGA